MGGAGAGSFGGPLGMGIGAVAGGLMGGMGGGQSDPNAHYRKMLEEYAKRQAPQMGPAAQAGQSGLVRNRSALVAQLEAMARGEGPSVAAQQMQDAMERSASTQASAAAGAGGRGVNQGAALRSAANNTAALQSQAARDTGMIRSSEQMGAMSQLGGVVGQGIASDNQQSQFNAGQLNQAQIENLRALGIQNEGQLRAILGAMGGTPAPQPGVGTQLLAGGASAMVPGLQYWTGQHQQQPQGFNQSPVGPQPGQPGWGSSPMGQGQPQQPAWSGPPPVYPTNPYAGY